MFRFATPYAFLLLIPALVAAWFVYRKRVTRGLLFPAGYRASSKSASWRVVAANIFPAVTLAGLILAIIALARPQTVLSSSKRSVDVIAIQMVVDVSGSMEALDMSEKTPLGMKYKTRLDAVKETFAEFIEDRTDDLIGLVTFGGYASTRCPMTTDHSALLHVLSGVEVPSPVQDSKGRFINEEELLTAVGDALATACARLKDSQAKSRVIVMLSDGESNTGIITPGQATEVARKMGIKVYTIGVGSTGKAPFMARDMFGRSSIQYANVKLDEELLRRIASKTGGRYFNVKSPDGLDKAMEEIDALEKTRVEREVFFNYNELFPWCLWPALALVLMGTGLNMLTSGRLV